MTPPAPRDAAHRPRRRRRRLIALGALAAVAGVVIAVVRSIGPEPWEQAAIDMAREFRILALPPDPYYSHRGSGPDNGKWGRPLEGMSVEVVYRDSQTLDTIQQSAEAAADQLGLYPAVCIQVDAKEGYERTRQRSDGGQLGCSFLDADKHPVGWLHAWQDVDRITVFLSFGEGRGTLRWMHLDPDDLP